MNIHHYSYADIKGGAARAAYRIHRSLITSCTGMASEMVVCRGLSGDLSVKAPTGRWARSLAQIRPHLTTPVTRLLATENPILHSPALLPSFRLKQIHNSNADVVHLHWIQHEMMSISDIGRIHKPVVWTLHDMWAFCGAEHLAWDNRWRDGYRNNNRPVHEKGFDLNRATWLRKRKHWKKPMQIVCPSNWLADCVRSSALMCDWPVSVIPNPIDTKKWKPINKDLARNLLDLPLNCPLVLFGALGGGKAHHKGFDLLQSAIKSLSGNPKLDGMQLLVFGELEPQVPPNFGFPVHYLGHLHDDLSLRTLYSAADVMVVPSRQESFGQTASEAHACGTPVVAFRTCGLKDVVEHLQTGYLANPFDPIDLSRGIKWILDDSDLRLNLAHRARHRAEKLWNYSRISSLYKQVYHTASVF